MKKYILSIIVFAATLFVGLPVFAEGSRTLYPDGATGLRAYLRSATSGNLQSWPFPNNGTHYVYAKPGEKIAMASSAQGFGSNNNTRWNNRERIELYGPDGSKIPITAYTGTNANNATYYGNIANRTAEKAGPRFISGVASGDKYEAIYYTVTVEGIYRVQFFSPGSGTSGSSGTANANWSQPNSDNIAAWDVSVINSTNNGYLDGRVYTNVLNMSVESNTNNGFRGIIYALTKDGYIYKVNNNGNNGIWFTFFVNNNGFVDPASSSDFNERTPLYKSLNNTTNISSSVHNPNNADVGSHITHKLFYNDPRANLPEQTDVNITFTGAVPGGSTWLRNKPITPEVSHPVVVGADGILGQVSSKGGIIEFNADVQGNYRIEIISDVPDGETPTFTKRVLIGQAKVGENKVIWDGKDGTPDNLGGPQPLPRGGHPIKVTVQLQGAEVHFPFFDMEMNINGTIIELLNAPADMSDADRNRVYWDDSDITIASGNNSGAAPSPRNNTHLEDRFDLSKPAGYNGNGNGLDSRTNGHKWGSTNMTGNSGFGNEKSIDTWAFITGEKKESQTLVNVRIADLYIESINTNIPAGESTRIGDEITYTVVAGNIAGEYSDVEDAPFSFILPPGFVGNPNDITFSSTCGNESDEASYDPATNTFNSKLDLPVGCEITYTFKATVTNQATSANTKASATIMRPADVTDPDATNTSDPSKPVFTDEVTESTTLDENYYYRPTNPFFEVKNNGFENNVSNNIKDNQIPNFIDDIRADNDINQTPMGVPVNGNVLTNDYSSNGILNVGSAKYYDANGDLQTLTLGTPTVIYDENRVEAGTIILNSNGKYSFTPDDGFVGDVPVEYTAINGDTTESSNNTADAILTITVIPATVPGNNPPIALDDVATTKKGVTLTGDILANDSDPDVGDVITVIGAIQGGENISIGASTPVSGKDKEGNPVNDAGSITINANGKITFVPNGDFVGTLDPIEYTISDGKGGTDKANIYITVIEDHGNTTFANDDANTAKKGVTMTGDILVNDFDPEGDNQTLTKIAIDGTSHDVPENGDDVEVDITGKGKLTINKYGEYSFVPNENFVGTVVVEQTVCDDGEPVACDNATLYLTYLPESDNSTTAVDDFYETGNNTPISGNVMENDYDNEDDNQRVTSTGTITSTEGGTVTIDEDGNFTYTPPADKNGIFDTFFYTVCDDGTPEACDVAEVIIAVGICYKGVGGKDFEWHYSSGGGTATETISQPATDFGFTFDIYELDNSFNMKINGMQLAVDEIEFQSKNTSGINIMFADGDKYETNTYKEDGTTKADIWEMRGDAANPLIRVVISHTGKITMYGSKVSYGPLFPLKFIEEKGNKFNPIDFSNAGGANNSIEVTQNRVGVTIMKGKGYGRNMVDCPNYWYGYDDNEWAKNSNWTDNYVPKAYENIEFATEDNNHETIYGISGPGAGKGAADKDLYLDDVKHFDKDGNETEGRIIGDLINKSDKDLVITTTNQLIIDGKVHGDNMGIIVVKADENDATGTLIFNNPNENENKNVAAKVEFINLADECADCGFYKRNWQYFGIPVQGGAFPFNNPLLDGETVRRWDEPTNGDKWLPVATESMIPFRGYEITSKETAPKYEFEGTLNVGNKDIELSKTPGVNYSGMNLLANSYTAAIPISAEAITNSTSALVTDAIGEATVYLFNRGTRDQWRKTNGGTVTGIAGGQYTAVPINLAGQATLPDRILSMHSFMVNAASDEAQISLKYDQLVKNETGTNQPAWRSTDNNGKRQLPYIVLDVIGEGSADRVWLFEESSTTRGYDNGWDGHKMLEGDLIQVFATDADQNKYQVTTVPQLDNITLGIAARENESYTISVSTAADVENRRLYLHDTFTGRGYLLKDGAEIIIPGTRSANQNRFKITASNVPAAVTEASTINTYVRDNVIVVENRSNENAIVSVYDISGRFVGKAQIAKDEMKSFPELSIAAGVKVVKVVSDSGAVNCSDRVLLK